MSNTNLNKFIDKRTQIRLIGNRISELARPLDAGEFVRYDFRDRICNRFETNGLYSYKFSLGVYDQRWADRLLELLQPLYAEFPRIRRIRITLSQPYGFINGRKMMSLRLWINASDKVDPPVQVQPTLPLLKPVTERYFMGHGLVKRLEISGKFILKARSFGAAVGQCYNHCDDIYWLKEIEQIEYLKLLRGQFTTF
jgi:hypothetical protein